MARRTRHVLPSGLAVVAVLVLVAGCSSSGPPAAAGPGSKLGIAWDSVARLLDRAGVRERKNKSR